MRVKKVARHLLDRVSEITVETKKVGLYLQEKVMSGPEKLISIITGKTCSEKLLATFADAKVVNIYIARASSKGEVNLGIQIAPSAEMTKRMMTFAEVHSDGYEFLTHFYSEK